MMKALWQSMVKYQQLTEGVTARITFETYNRFSYIQKGVRYSAADNDKVGKKIVKR